MLGMSFDDFSGIEEIISNPLASKLAQKMSGD